MNRRQMVIFPGIALVAGQALADTQQPATHTLGFSHETVGHYSRPKSFYTVPTTQVKQTKYVSFLATLLSLTPAQQSQAANTFAAAGASHAEAKKNMKIAKVSLSRFVKNNDGAGINDASASIGNLAAQRHSIGAGANAAFLQILTADQQTKLHQFRS